MATAFPTKFSGSVRRSFHSRPAAPGVVSPGPLRLLRSFAGAALAMIMLGGCAMAEPTDHPLQNKLTHVLAMRGCTQEDAPALEIYLTRAAYAGKGDPAAPYLRFEVASAASETLPAMTVSLVPLNRDTRLPGRIARGQLVETGTTPLWLSGTLSLTTAVPGKTAAGSYDVRTADGRRLHGSFSAAYSAKPTVCGG